MNSLLLTDNCTPRSTHTQILHVPVPVPVQGIPRSTFEQKGTFVSESCDVLFCVVSSYLIWLAVRFRRCFVELYAVAADGTHYVESCPCKIRA